MKSRFKVLSLIGVVLLIFGVSGTVLADNATDIDVEISYPYGQDEAVSDAAAGDSVNIYITLQDASGNPATAGPSGQALSAVTATISSNLGLTSSLTANAFVSDAVQVNFDTPSGVGAAARANVNYTGSNPGTDIITVVVPASPDPIIGIAEVNVVAANAAALAVRTYRNGSPSSVIYSAIDPQQLNGGSATENAGTAVPFWVIANDGGGNYTFAPNLEGLQVTVEAYADFNADGTAGSALDVPGYESTAIATATAVFANGIAQGTIVINNGLAGGLDVLLTAEVEVSATSTIGTTQMTAAGVALVDATVDQVPMLPGSAAKIVVGTDPYANGAYIVESSTCFSVLDDDAGLGGTPTPISVILADTYGNSVLSAAGTTVNATLGTGSTLELHPLIDGSGAAPVAGSTQWDIAAASYITTDLLQDGSGAANDAGSVAPGTLTFSSTGLTGDQVGVSLVPSNGAGTLDLQLDTDADGTSITAGTAIELTLTAPSGGTYLPIVNGDTLQITATSAAGAQLLSTVSGGFASASTTLTLAAVDEVPATTPDLEITVVIYGPCTTAAEAVTVTVTDISQCGISADNSATVITDIDPKAATILDVTGVDGQTADDLTADPVVITSDLIADGATQNSLLAGDGTTNELQELDEYGNVVDAAPTFTATSDIGIPTADPTDANPPANIILQVQYPAGAVGQTDTITCSTLGGLSRDFEIGSLVGATGPTGVATDLLVLQEGPQETDGELTNPEPGGEAIIRISANGTGTFNRNVQISFGEGSAEGAELRTLAGAALATPYTATLTLVPSLSDIRLVVSAEGCVTIEVTDLSGTPLNDGSLELCFGPEPTPCTVAVSPAAPSVQSGGTQQFTATTTGEGCVEGTYTWAVSESTCTSSGSIDETGLYTAPGDVVECTETITATDTANGDAEGTATVTVVTCTPEVNIGPSSVTLAPDATQTFTASTTCDGSTLSGTYTWAVSGGTLDTTSGDSVVFTAGSAGSASVTATDTANGDITATASITIQPIVTELIEAEYTGVFGGSAFLILPGQITIEGTGTNFTRFGSRVTYDSLLLLNYFKLVNDQTITQFVLLLPSIIIPGQDYPATVTVTVDGLSDDVEIPAFP